jgi:ribonuclease-3
MKSAIQKIYVIPDKQEKEQLDRLSQLVWSLFSYVNLTSNLYVIGPDLVNGMPQVEAIQKVVNGFLRANLFARLYVHFVHRHPQATMEEIDFYYQYYYQNWKRATREFDREAYMHQEIPRLMLLPVIIPDGRTEPNALIGLLGALKSAFMIPGLYLNQGTSFLASHEDLLAKAEKVYYGHGHSGQPADILCNLCHEDILHDTSARLEPNPVSMAEPCPAALIISAKEGKIYACMDAFLKNEPLAGMDAELDVEAMMAGYHECRKAQRGCLTCRERVVQSFSDLSLPQGALHQVGDLLYHFGTLHQETENHVQAVKRYEKSLKLSPVEEADPVHFRLGVSYTKIGRYDDALEAFSSAEKTYRDQYYFHFYTGLCYFEKGDYPVAIEKFSQAADMKPQQEDMVRVLMYLGTCCNCLGEYEEALVHLKRARHQASDVKEIYSALGFSYFQLKDYDQAIEHLRVAVELDPHSAIDYASLGANYREKGDMSMAIGMYEKALAFDPSMTSAQGNLERLKETVHEQQLLPLENDLGYHFKDRGFLCEALRHSSYVNEQREPALKDNERLEFLGDAVLDLVVTHTLMHHFPETREGDLSRMRATIVNESQLAMVGQKLHIGEYLLLGRGEALSHGEEKSSILADALEAVIGAVYLDGGLEAAFGVVDRQFSELMVHVGERLSAEDFKSRLQEFVQAKFKTIPEYRVEAESGPDHDKKFEIRLTVGTFLTTRGTGKSKKAAEQAAARVALDKLQGAAE